MADLPTVPGFPGLSRILTNCPGVPDQALNVLHFELLQLDLWTSLSSMSGSDSNSESETDLSLQSCTSVLSVGAASSSSSFFF